MLRTDKHYQQAVSTGILLPDFDILFSIASRKDRERYSLYSLEISFNPCRM